MKVVSFSLLDNDQKTDMIMKEGVFLFKRLTDKHRIYLFQLYGFYVEMVYENGSGELSWIDTFESTAMLGSYLPLIDISALTT